MLRLHLLQHCSQLCVRAVGWRSTSLLLLLLLVPGWRRHLPSCLLCACLHLLRCHLQQLLVLLSKRQLAQRTHALSVACELQQRCHIIITQHFLTCLHPLLLVLMQSTAAFWPLLLLLSSVWLLILQWLHSSA
jgi:hypothetical protein